MGHSCPVKFMTWNVQGRVGEWEERATAILATLAAVDPDVVFLQESWVEKAGGTQAASFGESLGRHHVTAEALAGFDRYPDAPHWVVNAILSRWPIHLVHATPLPDEHGEPTWRHVLLARVERPASAGGPLLVAGTHLEHGLDRSATRQAQTAALCRHLDEALGPRADRTAAPPAVLGADLNAVPWSEEVRGLTGAARPFVDGLVLVDAWDAAGNTGRGDTWAAMNPRVPARAVHPNRRLDYLMVTWPRARGRGHVTSCALAGTAAHDGVWPSDHFAVVAEIDL